MPNGKWTEMWVQALTHFLSLFNGCGYSGPITALMERMQAMGVRAADEDEYNEWFYQARSDRGYVYPAVGHLAYRRTDKDAIVNRLQENGVVFQCRAMKVLVWPWGGELIQEDDLLANDESADDVPATLREEWFSPDVWEKYKAAKGEEARPRAERLLWDDLHVPAGWKKLDAVVKGHVSEQASLMVQQRIKIEDHLRAVPPCGADDEKTICVSPEFVKLMRRVEGDLRRAQEKLDEFAKERVAE